MRKISLTSFIFFLLMVSVSAAEEPAYTEVGFEVGDVYEFIVKDTETVFFGIFTISPGETFNMTVKSLPDESFRVSEIDFQYKNRTSSEPMHANMQTDYFIYNNWEFWTEMGTYNRTFSNTSSIIGSVHSDDTTFTFNATIISGVEVINSYLVYDLNGVIISEKSKVNGIVAKHFERVFPVESNTEMTSSSYIITSNGETITEATIIDPLPFPFSYLYFLFLPILLKFKSRLV